MDNTKHVAAADGNRFVQDNSIKSDLLRQDRFALARKLEKLARRNYIREVKDEVMFQCCFGLDFR